VRPKSLRQLQASSSLFYEVFRKYDAGNRLLGQARPRCCRRNWRSQRLTHTLRQLAAAARHGDPGRAQPLRMPLMVERLREQLSTEKLKDRLDRMLAESAAVLDQPAARLRRARRRQSPPVPD
jgi:ATP-dependent Lhr-like helicase